MRITTATDSKALLFAGIAVIAGAAIVLTTGAADAARVGRDAAIEKCVAYARQVGGETGGSHKQTALYKSCMMDAGYRP